MIRKFNTSLIRKGFYQALGVTAYCGLVGAVLWKGDEVFGRLPNFFGPVTFLLLFSVSALICATLVFYKPYLLFFDNRKKDAVDLVLFTTSWLFLFFIVFLLFAVYI